MRKFISLLLVMMLILSLCVTSFAQMSDIENHWAKESISFLVEKGALSGYPDGTFKPDNPMSKAEFYKIINELLGFEKKAEVKYSDVSPKDWFYDHVAKALAAAYITPTTLLSPNEYITRQEVSRIIGVVYKIGHTSTSATIFSDSSLIPKEILGYIGAMVDKGILNGYPDGSFRPGANITRAEVAQLMLNILKEYVSTSKMYKEIENGNVIVNMPGAALDNLTVKGDLIIAEGVGEGDVTLDNVKVEGRMLVRAGGENSIIIKGDSKIDTIIIVKQGNTVRILNETGREIAVTTVEGDADVILEGKFKNVIVQSPDITVNARNTEIENIEINGTRSKVIVDKDSKIDEIVVKAANVVIGGEGKVKEVEVKAGGTGTEITTPETQINVNRGANNVTGTGGIEIGPNETYVNGKTEKQDAKKLKEDSTNSGSSGGSDGPVITRYSVSYTVVGGNGALESEVNDNSRVRKGTIVKFTATPKTGYEIKNWEVNGEIKPVNGNVLFLEILTNTTVTVEFKLIEVEPPMHTVIYSVVGEGGTIDSTINSGIGVAPNTELTFTAKPSTGYEVKEWKVNGLIVEAENTLTTTITAYTMVSVEFQEIVVPPTMYKVTYLVVGEGGTLTGSVPNGGQASNGSSVSFTAVRNEGFRLKEWRINDIVQSHTDLEFNMEITENTNVEAIFVAIDVITAPEVIMTVNNTNILRLDFDTSDVWVDECHLEDIESEMASSVFLYKVFGNEIFNGSFTDDKNIRITTGSNYIEIELLDNAIIQELFEFRYPEIDNYERDTMRGRTVFIRNLTPDLSIFKNGEGMPSNSTTDLIDLRFEFSLDFGDWFNYDGDIYGIWVIKDSTPPELVSIVPNNTKYLEPDERAQIKITANDANIYRLTTWANIDFEYYALPDPYNGNTGLKEYEESEGYTVTYEDGTWTMDFGEMTEDRQSYNIFIEIEDFAGNKWSDTVDFRETYYRLEFVKMLNDRTELDELLDIIDNQYYYEDYTEVTWSKLANALDMPEDTKDEINLKVAALRNALAQLEYIPVDRAKLDDILEFIDTLVPKDYEESGWIDLMYVKTTMPENTQNDINLKISELNKYIGMLEYIGTPDKTRLNELIDYIKSLNEEDYTEETWERLIFQISRLEEDTQIQIDYKVEVLEMSIFLLEYADVDRTELYQLLNYIGELEFWYYTEESYENVMIIVWENYERTREEVNNKVTLLIEAIEDLEFRQAYDKESLEAELEYIYKDLVESDYTEDSWAHLMNIIDIMPETTQKEVDDKVEALQLAISSLVLIVDVESIG